MGVFRQFPYSNFHEMNMDEIIKIIKNMLEEWARYHAEWDQWMADLEESWSEYQDDVNAQWAAYQNTMNTAWQSMQNFINDYFDNLDLQEEVNNKIVSMLQTGEFGMLVNEYIPPAVNAWLNLHITEPTGVVIDTSLTVAGACADAKATGDSINKVKSNVVALKDEILGDTSYIVENTANITAGSGISANNKIITINIPSGNIFTIKIVDNDHVLSGNTMSLYWWDGEGNRTVFANNRAPNTPYDYKINENITGFSIYAPDAATVGTGSITMEVEVIRSTNNLIEASNIESGAYKDGTGTAYNAIEYSRMVKPIVCKAGTRISSAIEMNAFEYDIITGDFITSIENWAYSYTVQNDCALKLIWRTTTTNKNQIIAGMIVAPPQDVLEKTVIPINSIRQLSNIESKKYIQSETIRSISHRGDYLECQGMMCGGSAVISAKRNGYRVVENDVNITSDGKMVMWHDATLEAIGDPTHSTSDYTLAQLKAMDFGSSYGSEFAGETILTFAEWILLCKQVGVDCYIDFKITEEDFPDTLAQEMVSTIRQYGMLDHVTYLNNFSKIRQYHHDARIALLTAPTLEIIETYLSYLEDGEVIFNPASVDLNSENAQLAFNNGFGLECYYVDYSNTSKAQIFAEIERVVALGIQGISLDIYRIEDVFIDKYNLL